MRQSATFLSIVATAVIAASPANSATLQIGEPSLAIGATSFDFLPAGPGAGSFSVGAGSTGIFVGLTGTSGAIKDLNITVPPPVPQFMTFAAQPTLQIDLTSIANGVGFLPNCFAAPAAGQTCTPNFLSPTGTSPLNLVNTKTGSIASFSVTGTSLLTGTATPVAAPVTATFTTQFAGQSYQNVLATLAAGGSVSASYSATVATAGAPSSTLQVGQPVLGALPTIVDFFPPGPAAGPFNIGGTSTGVFTPLAGSPVVIQDLNLAALGVGTSTSLANFITLLADPTKSFDLELIHTGSFGAVDCFAAPAAGQTCTPFLPSLANPDNPLGASAYSLMNTATGSTLSFEVEGTMHDLSLGQDFDFSAIFTAQYETNYQSVLQTMLLGGFIPASFSAALLIDDLPSTPVPEPASLALLLGGAIPLLRRRRRPR